FGSVLAALQNFYCASLINSLRATIRMTFRNTVLLLALAVCCCDVPAQSSQPLLADRAGAKFAQNTSETATSDRVRANGEAGERGSDNSESAKPDASKAAATQFRVERIKIDGGAELLTIFGRLDGMRTAEGAAPEVPLISVLRDTLSDANPENDRL